MLLYMLCISLAVSYASATDLYMYATREKVKEDEVNVHVNMTMVGPLPPGEDMFYVDYETEDGSAIQPADYVGISGQAVFTDKDRVKIIIIIIKDDYKHEMKESFKLKIIKSTCCANYYPKEITVHIWDDEWELYGDPHFSIPLVSGEKLCYSIQGYAGLPFNLISSKHLTINAMFINSINDATEATWIGKLAVIPRNVDKPQPIVFDSVTQEVKIEGQGHFKAAALRQITVNSSNGVAVKFTKGLIKQDGNPVVRVHFMNLQATFDVTFYINHLDVAWQIQDHELQDSHGLLGQFMRGGVEIDRTRKILIRPGFEPVPVDTSTTWGLDKRHCWKAMNTGLQGEGLIEGKILDYHVTDVLQEDFIFHRQ